MKTKANIRSRLCNFWSWGTYSRGIKSKLTWIRYKFTKKISLFLDYFFFYVPFFTAELLKMPVAVCCCESLRYFFALLSMFNFVWNVSEFGRDNSVYITFNIINEPRQGQARFTKVKQTNLESVKIVFQVKLPNRRFYSMDILLTKMWKRRQIYDHVYVISDHGARIQEA